MKLIIDIPDSAYKVCYDLRNVGDTNCLADILVNAVGVGTPIPDNATVCDIEDIKADIEAARYGLINDGLDVALRIIDKHCPSCGAKMESEE